MVDDIGVITEALAVKIQEVFGPLLDTAIINKDIIYAPEDIALRQRAEATSGSNKPSQQDKEKYKLEFISFWLESAQFSWDRNRTPLGREGLNIGETGGTNSQYRLVKAAPIDLEFTIILWTLKKARANNFIKQYCFLQLNNPQIKFFWDNNKPLEMDFFIRPNIKQEDTVSKMYVEGKYWKPQVAFKVEGWLLQDTPINFAKRVVLDIWSSNTLGVSDESVHVLHNVETE